MIKTTAIIIGFSALSLGAANPNGVPAIDLNPITAVDVKIAHLDIQAKDSGVKTLITDTSDFALRFELKSGQVINVRF